MNQDKKSVAGWLAVVCAMVLVMVVVGGITRLTRSGLSIVEWRPVTGAVPPLSETAWQEEFEKYQATPEYRHVNRGISLADFKQIFFWEYLHRLLGRLAGVLFIVPYLFFLIRKRLDRRLAVRLLIGLALASLEGPMGWFMVKSGLVDAPHVSHYRLTTHLTLAFVVFGYLFWILLDLMTGTERRFRGRSLWLIAALFLEVLYGGLTAGLKAGYGYNTFPRMGDDWIPPGLFASFWNLFENPATVQFLHRLFGILLVIGVIVFRLFAGQFPLNRVQRWGLNLLVLLVVGQAVLGVYTLVNIVPLVPAVIHQGAALVVFGSALFVAHSFSPPRTR